MSDNTQPKTSRFSAEIIRGVITVSACMVLAAPFAYKLNRNIPPQIATVDIQSILEEEQKNWVDGLSTDANRTKTEKDEMESRSIRFAVNLSTAVDKLGEDCRCIVLNKAAVLSGGYMDLTDVLKKRLKK